MDRFRAVNHILKLRQNAPDVAALLEKTLNGKHISLNSRINNTLNTSDLPINSLVNPPGNFVSIILRNGLGNRIFQLLAAIGYAEKYNKQCVISRAHITSGIKSHEKNLESMITKIFPSINTVDSIQQYTQLREVKEMNYSQLSEHKSSVVLQGYFQDERYFPSKALIPVIRTSYYENTYFIHIRAGDYLDPGSFGLDLVKYHTKCFSELSNVTENINYLVFSNDNTYADTYMKQFGIQYTISDKINPLETLVEMANCAGGICANSTFSWLGGFFQGDRRGKIFMPSVWLRGRDCKGVYPTWATVIDVGEIFRATPVIPVKVTSVPLAVTPIPFALGAMPSAMPLAMPLAIPSAISSPMRVAPTQPTPQLALTIPPKQVINSGGLVSVGLGNCGLGNKIFMILAGLAYAEKYNKEFVIDRSRNIPSSITLHTQNLDTALMKLFPKIRWIDSVLSSNTIYEKIMFIYSDLPNQAGNVVLNGYFQNELYFPSPSLIPDIRTAYYSNTYFVHIRAGDYINNPQYDILPNSNYYNNCFSILGSNAKYIVFSNDNIYADKYMKQFNVQYTISDKTCPLDTLIEMANCAGGICANSSLSWLGAFFQREPKINICMPSIWLNNGRPDIQHPKWTSVIDIYSKINPIKQYGLLYTEKIFDIVIPVGPNDIDIICQQIQYTKKNIIGYRNIYLIYKDISLELEDCITISEEIFPFNMQTVENFHGKLKRNGWYLQQLLKLYAGVCINGILESYLVIDSDTFFLKPTRFIEDNKYLYCFGKEYNLPYFTHMNKLHSSLIKMDINKSGICHHMIFNTRYLNELFKLVEDYHSQDFYKVFLSSVDASALSYSGASEYEIYFNFLLKYHPEAISIRTLQWNNVNTLSNNGINHYESVHWYIRNTTNKNNTISINRKISNIPNIYNFNSLKIKGVYVIIDIFRSSKYNSLVFLCNNKNYITENCKLNIFSLSAKGFTVKHLIVDRSRDYIEANKNYFSEGFHHEIFYIPNFPEDISSVCISLENTEYIIDIHALDNRFLESKCLTTIQKNEIHLIEPWIDWHKKLGFEYFFIYDNNFNINNYSELLKKYPSELIIYNADFPYWLESYGRNSIGQIIQQNHTLWKFSPEFLGLTDLDEYIYPLSNFNIFDKGISILSIPNYWFGCSGNNTFQENIMQYYIKRESVGNPVSQRKCIVQSSQLDLVCVHIVLNYTGIYKRAKYSEIYLRHYFNLSNKKRTCNCSIYCAIEDIPIV